MGMKEVAIAGLVAGFVSFIIGIAFYMNPVISGIQSQYTWVGYKSMDFIGGLNNWYVLLLVSNLFLTFFIAILYSYTEQGIAIKSAWKKGLFFGFLLFLVSGFPSVCYKWMLSSYPDMLNVIDVVGFLVSNLIVGAVLAVVYEKLSSKS